jgi:lysophospholipase L1-like esterase
MGGVTGTPVPLPRRLTAEFLGSAFLAAVVIGSGIAAQRLSSGQTGLQLLENAAATAAGLYAISAALRARVAGFGDPDATEERFAQLEGNLATIGRRARDRAPACRVLFVDYLTILPPRGDDRGEPPPAEIAEWGRAIAARLATTTRAAAEAADCEYVAASAASADHHAWSATPWTRRFHLSLRGGAPYHPDAAGMAAVAELVLGTLAASPGRLAG